jgi:hypothetical protein
MNKTRSYLHVFSKNFKLTHCYFKFSPSILAIESTTWILFIFWPSKIRVSLTGVVSSLFAPRCHLSSDRCRYVVMSCHAYFSWSQNELTASTLSSDNVSSCWLPSRAKTETYKFRDSGNGASIRVPRMFHSHV